MIDIVKARKNLELKLEKERSHALNRYNQAVLDADAIIQCIKTEYAPQKIYQWGSLLHPERFTVCSDIDIAIEGITDAETFFRLLGDAMKLTKFPLDIVQMEKIEPEFAESIRASGKVVYEHP